MILAKLAYWIVTVSTSTGEPVGIKLADRLRTFCLSANTFTLKDSIEMQYQETLTLSPLYQKKDSLGIKDKGKDYVQGCRFRLSSLQRGRELHG